MKNILIPALISGLLIMTGLTGCREDGPEIIYNFGTFPDSVYNLEGINSAYDDYNAALPTIGGSLPIMFSSNRSTSGENFDVVTGLVTISFNQIDGSFMVYGEPYSSPFFSALESKVNTDTDQLGPFRFLNSPDGKEYFIYSSESTSGDLDLFFLRYLPPSLYVLPEIPDPLEVTRFNSSNDDAYLSIDWDKENVYLTSDRSGDFDIYTSEIDRSIELSSWLAGDPGEISVADSVNSSGNDKCPFIFDQIMIFTSDRPEGFGGFDLYYSVFLNGKWNSPVNFGPRINTE